MTERVEIPKVVGLRLERQIRPVDHLAGRGQAVDRNHSRIDESDIDALAGVALAPRVVGTHPLDHPIHRPLVQHRVVITEEGSIVPSGCLQRWGGWGGRRHNRRNCQGEAQKGGQQNDPQAHGFRPPFCSESQRASHLVVSMNRVQCLDEVIGTCSPNLGNQSVLHKRTSQVGEPHATLPLRRGEARRLRLPIRSVTASSSHAPNYASSIPATRCPTRRRQTTRRSTRTRSTRKHHSTKRSTTTCYSTKPRTTTPPTTKRSTRKHHSTKRCSTKRRSR